MRYVTIAMLVKHAGKHRSSVLRAMKAAGVTPERTQGMKGLRLPEKDANRFLAKQWPEVGPLPPQPPSPLS